MTLLDFRKKLCEIGRDMFDEQYNIYSDQKFELTPEEISYQKHITNCPVCSEVVKSVY